MANLKPEYALRARLIADAQVTAIVSTRIYPPGAAPQGAAYPFIVYQRGNSEHFHKMGSTNSTTLQQHEIVIAMYGEDYDALTTLANEVRSSLDGYRGTITVSADSIRFEQFLLMQQEDNSLQPSDGKGRPLFNIDQRYQVAFNEA